MSMGYIALHRQITENEFYFAERFTKAQAWIDLLLLANHKPATVFIRGIEINLKSGELCWSQLSLAKRWKWDRKTVANVLLMFQKRKMLDIKKSRVTTIISILNWNRYQINGQQLGQQKDNNLDTDNNDKNDNNYTAEFERFWDAYGKKVDREKCYKIWTKLTEAEKEKIFNTLSNYISNTPELKFRKNPLTYLHGKCWNDEITQTDVKQKWNFE